MCKIGLCIKRRRKSAPSRRGERSSVMRVLCGDVSGGVERVAVPVVVDNTDVDAPVLRAPSIRQYIRCRVPSATLPTSHLAPFYEQYVGCRCAPADSCNSHTCSCIHHLADAPPYTPHRTINLHLDWTNRTILECSHLCACAAQLSSSSCNNRLVQYGVSIRTHVFHNARKGWGLRSAEFIRAGQFVCEYAGEIIDGTEARARIMQHEPGEPFYIYILDEYVTESGDRKCRTITDPSNVGNLARFINHSCEPNLLLVPVRIETGVPRLALFSRGDIYSGTELTMSYAQGASDSATSLRKQSTFTTCHCGSHSCKGVLPFHANILTQ